MPESPYDAHPGFYQDDNRKARTLTPVTKEQLENKHAAMFAEWNVRGKTVLDLGSAIGATGQWVLFHDAKKYVGVESQETYASKSRELLDHYGDKAKIIHGSIDQFLKDNTEKFDVIVMLGVIYGYLNQYDILKKITSICNEVLIIEGMYPQPHVGNAECPIIEISDKHTMVLADQEKSVYGLGARITPAALEILMSTMGFESIGQLVKPKQIKGSIDNYSGDPTKYYLVRYICTFKNTGHINKQLTEILSQPNLEGVDKVDWSEANDKAKYVDPHLPTLAEKQWEFDEKVAVNFENEARTNIPDYDRVIDLCIDITDQLCQKDAKIIDVGCALGETLKRFYHRGYRQLFGVDSSQHMIEQAFQPDSKDITYIQSYSFPQQYSPFNLVTANWVLQFIKERTSYLKEIYDSLLTGGSLILTEKVMLSDTVDKLYKNFKRKQGLSEQYIAYKEEAIKEVLVSFPLEWYLIKLREVGFRSVEIVNANYSFVTFFAEK